MYRGVSRETQSINRAGELINIINTLHEPLNLSEFEFLKAQRGKFHTAKERKKAVKCPLLCGRHLLRREFDFGPIFRHCGEINLNISPNIGKSAAAGLRAMNEGKIAATFSATNGIGWVQIYAPSPKRLFAFVNEQGI